MNILSSSKIPQELLRNKCEDITSHEEAEIIIRLLEAHLKANKGIDHLSAPEIGIYKRVAIIRFPKEKVNLVNPKIVHSSGHILSIGEDCYSFEGNLNCYRNSSIMVENGLDKKKYTYAERNMVCMVQHEIDHLEGKLFKDKTIKLAVLREDFRIEDKRKCFCGSRKEFWQCCKTS